MGDEIDFDSRDIVPRHRWVADQIDRKWAPLLGEWNTPLMLREGADEIERLRAELAELKGKGSSEDRG